MKNELLRNLIFIYGIVVCILMVFIVKHQIQTYRTISIPIVITWFVINIVCIFGILYVSQKFDTKYITVNKSEHTIEQQNMTQTKKLPPKTPDEIRFDRLRQELEHNKKGCYKEF
ncbi:hypothetical protein [Filifactor alocis]|uniref:hypothetical protein n=1 Tax=Filifactor alocis TaxID=143361 RepID=UPI003FA03145